MVQPHPRWSWPIGCWEEDISLYSNVKKNDPLSILLAKPYPRESKSWFIQTWIYNTSGWFHTYIHTCFNIQPPLKTSNFLIFSADKTSRQLLHCDIFMLFLKTHLEIFFKNFYQHIFVYLVNEIHILNIVNVNRKSKIYVIRGTSGLFYHLKCDPTFFYSYLTH